MTGREEKSRSWMEGCHVDTGYTGGSAVAEVKVIIEDLGKAVEVVAGGAVGKRGAFKVGEVTVCVGYGGEAVVREKKKQQEI